MNTLVAHWVKEKVWSSVVYCPELWRQDHDTHLKYIDCTKKTVLVNILLLNKEKKVAQIQPVITIITHIIMESKKDLIAAHHKKQRTNNDSDNFHYEIG